MFVQMVGASLILPILPLYALGEFGLSPQAITLLAASFFAAQFIAGPYLGRLSDKIGRVPVLLASQVGTVIAFIALGAAPAAWVLYAARILDGITGGNIIVAQAYVTDITPAERRSEALGLILAAFGIAFFVGPAIGGFASQALGPRVPYYLAAVAALITLLLTWFTLDETHDESERAARAASGHKLTPRLVLNSVPAMLTLSLGFLSMFVLGLVIAVFALFGEAVLFADWEADAIGVGVGLILTAVGLSQFLTQTLLIRPALTRYGELRLIQIGVLVRATGLTLIAITSNPWIAAAGSALFACGMGLTTPPTQSAATKSVADALRGGILGLYQSVSSLGTIISTAIGGILFAIDPFLAFRIGAVLAFLALIPAVGLERSVTKARQESLD
ncbi:MAG: MFS transporter [Acidimicrobiia bacterium]|nr:MFS transporter [Acidimicrobiia bacterium]